MKKIMMAVAIVCAAAMTQAAAYNWQSSSTSSKGKLYAGNSSLAYGTYGAVTLYMFDAATYAQETAFAALKAGTLDTTKAVTSTTLASTSKITTKSFDYGTQGEKYDFYFATVLDSKNFYISSMMEDKINPTSGSTPLTYADLDTTSKTTKAAGATFAGAGFYNIPEPTSGLLLLVGMAGLVLRRGRRS